MLATNEIFLRKAKMSDLDSMFELWVDKSMATYMLWQPIKTKEEAKERLIRMIDYQQTHDSFFIALKSNDEAIGFCGIVELEEGIYAETGLAIKKKYQNKGYGGEALKLIIEYGFNELKAQKIGYECMKENYYSNLLAQSNGFVLDHETKGIRSYDNFSYETNFYYLKKK